MNTNDTLPENLQGLMRSLSKEQAIPLGEMDNTPMLAVKIGTEFEHFIKDGGLASEMKASILNVDFEDNTIALCFVQVRLNQSDEMIYTATYDLNFEKQYEDCYALLNMKNYGLFVASENIHDFISFTTDFEAKFEPRAVLEYAKNESKNYKPQMFEEISYGLRTQASSPKALWDYLNTLAPFDQSWYGRIKMGKDKV